MDSAAIFCLENCTFDFEFGKGACMRMAFDHPIPTLATWADPSLGQLYRVLVLVLSIKQEVPLCRQSMAVITSLRSPDG
jgi:hypothetical protein